MKLSLSMILVLSLFGIGCKEDDPVAGGGDGTMQVSMVDAPATLYDSIIVNVTEVAVHSTTEANGWITLTSGPRRYDLLSLVNGAEAVLGQAKLSAGTYTQLRMTVGDSCDVYSSGVRMSVKVPSGQIILNIHAEVSANATTSLVLDFDAARSLVMSGASMVMKPVIRVLTTSSVGSIEGSVNVRSSVMAVGGGDTLSTITGANTSFKIRYMKPGTYSLTVVSGSALFYDSTLTNVTVAAGSVTNVGMINLRAKL